MKENTPIKRCIIFLVNLTILTPLYCNPLPQNTSEKTASDKEQKFFDLGQECGKKIVAVLRGNSLTPEQDILEITQAAIAKEVAEEFRYLGITPTNTPEYKTSFLLLKRYMAGIKSIIESYELVDSEDPTVHQKNLIAVQQRIALDCFLEAPNHHEWKKNLEQMMQAIEGSETTPTEQPATLAGHELGTSISSCFIQATMQQPAIEQCKELVTEFFNRIEVMTALERKKALFNFFTGIQKALKESSLDKQLTQFPPAEVVRIKNSYKKALTATQKGLSFAFHALATFHKTLEKSPQ